MSENTNPNSLPYEDDVVSKGCGLGEMIADAANTISDTEKMLNLQSEVMEMNLLQKQMRDVDELRAARLLHHKDVIRRE